jgi:hypothetical protein
MCRTSRCCRQIDDVLFIDMTIRERDWVVSQMYPTALELKEVCRSPGRIFYLDMEICRDRAGFFTTLYDKRDELQAQGMMGAVRKFPHITSVLSNRCKYGCMTGFLHRIFRIQMRVKRFQEAAARRVADMWEAGYRFTELMRYTRRFMRGHY